MYSKKEFDKDVERRNRQNPCSCRFKTFRRDRKRMMTPSVRRLNSLASRLWRRERAA